MNNKDQWTTTFTLRFSKTLGIGFGISFLVCASYWFIMSLIGGNSIPPSDIITLFSGCLVGFSLIIASKSIENNIYTHNEKIEFERDLFYQRMDFDSTVFLQNLVSHWYNDLSFHVGSSRNIMKTNESKFKTKEGSKELLEYFYNNPKEMESFYAVLNFLEHLSTMVDSKFLKEEDVKANFGSVFRVYYTTAKLFIDTSREEKGDYKKATFCNFEKLAEKWIY